MCCDLCRVSESEGTQPTRSPAEGPGDSAAVCRKYAMKPAVDVLVVNLNEVTGKAEMETVMTKREGMSLVAKQQGVVCISAAANGQRTMREGTTGRVISMTLPKVWAVAEGGQAALAKQQAPALKDTRAVGVEVRFYRKYTEGLLRRYMQMSLEAGRVPSMLGREVLGGRASSYRIHGFDDAVNFRLDVEKCLRQLEPAQREVLRRVAMQEYTQAEAAVLLGICLRTCVDRYGKALDRLTGILLRTRLLEPLRMLSMGRS